MGALLGKLWGKASTKDLLEKITCQLKDIKSFNRDTQAWQKKVIGTLVAYFSVIYLLGIVFAYYYYYNDPEWQDIPSKLKLLTPFLVAPLIIFFLKRILTWWYHRKVRKNETHLAKLEEERTKILEDVMDTETYKVAKEILDKYGPVQQITKPTKRLTSSETKLKTGGGDIQATPSRPSLIQEPGGNNTLRQRHSTSHLPGSTLSTLNNQPSSHPGSPFRTISASNSGNISEGGSNRPTTASDINTALQKTPGPFQKLSSQHTIQRRVPGPPLPRPVLPRERGYMDKVVEYLVGDGPSNRYALICKQCQSHNGMALKEEFEYIAYRCCYCFYWNPARKQRPVAPKLQPPPVNSPSSTDSSSEEEDAILSKNKHSPPKLTTALPEEKKQDRQGSNQTEKLSDASEIQEPQVEDTPHKPDVEDHTQEEKAELNTDDGEFTSKAVVTDDTETKSVEEADEEEMDISLT